MFSLRLKAKREGGSIIFRERMSKTVKKDFTPKINRKVKWTKLEITEFVCDSFLVEPADGGPNHWRKSRYTYESEWERSRRLKGNFVPKIVCSKIECANYANIYVCVYT